MQEAMMNAMGAMSAFAMASKYATPRELGGDPKCTCAERRPIGYTTHDVGCPLHAPDELACWEEPPCCDQGGRELAELAKPCKCECHL